MEIVNRGEILKSGDIVLNDDGTYYLTAVGMAGCHTDKPAVRMTKDELSVYLAINPKLKGDSSFQYCHNDIEPDKSVTKNEKFFLELMIKEATESWQPKSRG
jgi:hypothetical protein